MNKYEVLEMEQKLKVYLNIQRRIVVRLKIYFISEELKNLRLADFEFV